MDTTRHNSKYRDALFDYGIPLLLVVFACLALWAYPRMIASRDATGLDYLFVFAVFGPLIVRRKFPLAVLALTTFLSALYALGPNPPAPTQLDRLAVSEQNL